jgi:septal ring factor EnvC (AmiA/AmiB activator)
MNQITYENKILGFEKEIITSEKTITDLEKKLTDYEDDLKSLIGTNSNEPGSTNEKEFAIQIADTYQSIKQYIITIDDFL